MDEPEPPMPVEVELFGIPRQRAGCGRISVDATTVGDAIDAIQRHLPALTDLRQHDGSLSGHYLLSLDGERFLTDLAELLAADARLLLLSADAGG